jgi:hypothetical protein
MMRTPKLVVAALALGLAGCSSTGGGGGFGSDYYSLVRVRSVQVGDGSVAVTAPRPWNRTRKSIFSFEDVRQVEDWTLNGPLLDNISFITGLRNNRQIIYERRTEDRQVPRFRSDMSAPEITALLESFYRVRAGSVDFRTLSLQPRLFLGANGFQFDFEHLDSDELWRKGRAVGAVIDGKLYLILLDAARSHYFASTVGDFEAIVASARRRR